MKASCAGNCPKRLFGLGVERLAFTDSCRSCNLQLTAASSPKQSCDFVLRAHAAWKMQHARINPCHGTASETVIRAARDRQQYDAKLRQDGCWAAVAAFWIQQSNSGNCGIRKARYSEIEALSNWESADIEIVVVYKVILMRLAAHGENARRYLWNSRPKQDQIGFSQRHFHG